MYRKSIEINGKTLTIETGKMAKQAHGSCTVRYGDTVVLATAVSDYDTRPDQDFFPLTVEYRERSYSAGKIPGGFFKREGKPSDKNVLSARLTDRPIRPLFKEGFKSETQLVVFVISFDNENPADVLGTVGASAALMLSDIPFEGPIAAVRVGKVDGQYIINPTLGELEQSTMDLIVAGTENDIVMVEGEALEISEEELVEALTFAQDPIRKIVQLQKELTAEAGKPKREVVVEPPDEELVRKIKEATEKELPRWRELGRISKQAYNTGISNFIRDLVEQLSEEYPDCKSVVRELVDEMAKADMRRMIIEEGVRLDGRSLEEIRPITCETSILPRTHGSALFTRGETQALVVTTLGTKTDEQKIDEIEGEFYKRFMLHYNFPPFCVGETRPFRGPGRREIGHGNLAERALKNLLPEEEDFPYTIQVVSDILESNGSSSMATVCGGSLSLMDAGVPLKKTVAGIAMGLIKEGEKVVILSDILGAEDHYGDMDFKVAGTRDGITAIQMDIKIEGLSVEIMRQALAQAREGRLKIIEIMEKELAAPRPKLSPYAPKVIRMPLPADKIGDVIGPGGKMIRYIANETGAEIWIDENGVAFISAPDQESGEKAHKLIQNILRTPVVGEVFEGVVKEITSFGAFVEILPGKEGLLPISELEWSRTRRVEDVVKVGDKVQVKLIGTENGKLKLSRKVLIAKPDNYQRQSSYRRDRSHGKGRHDSGRDHRRRY